jgi:hypothetical protein
MPHHGAAGRTETMGILSHHLSSSLFGNLHQGLILLPHSCIVPRTCNHSQLMSKPSPALTKNGADHTLVRKLRFVEDTASPCMNLEGLTVLSSTIDEHSLQGSNGFFKGSYSWTEDTLFAVSPRTADSQTQRKKDSTFHSHPLKVQTHRRVVEWYRPGSGGSEYHRWVHIHYQDAFVAWETFSFDTSSGEDEITVGNRSSTTLEAMLKRLCNDLDVGQLPNPHDDVSSRLKDTTTESSHLGVVCEDDGDEHNYDEDDAHSSIREDNSAECQQTREESKLFRVLAGELVDDEAVVYGLYGDLETLALWEIAKNGYEC